MAKAGRMSPYKEKYEESVNRVKTLEGELATIRERNRNQWAYIQKQNVIIDLLKQRIKEGNYHGK